VTPELKARLARRAEAEGVPVGVVALLAEGGLELDGGDEEGARLADGLEVAVHLEGSGAVAVGLLSERPQPLTQGVRTTRGKMTPVIAAPCG